MDWENATHYEVLQVAQNASLVVIKASYRVLIQQYHPDKAQQRDEAERITKRLNEAYSVLQDPELRAVYDEWIRARASADANEPSSGAAPPDPPSASPGSAAGATSKWAAVWQRLDFRFWLLCAVFAVLTRVVGLVGTLIFVAAWSIAISASRGRTASLRYVAVAASVFIALMAWLGLNGAVLQKWTPAAVAKASTVDSQPEPPNCSPGLWLSPNTGLCQSVPETEEPAGRAELDKGIAELGDAEWAEAYAFWQQSHPEYTSPAESKGLSLNLQAVVNQYPRIAAGAALDLAHQKWQSEKSSDVSAPDAASMMSSAAPQIITGFELGAAVGADNEVATPTTVFSSRDTIHTSVDTSGNQNFALTARWIYQDGQLVHTETKVVPAGPQVTDFSITKPDGWPAGGYRLELLVDGSLAQARNFKVN